MRISCTTLESFRLFNQPEQEWMTEDDLLATIRGQFVPNRKVLIGQAFGAVLEHPERYRVSGGYTVRTRGDVGEDFDADVINLSDEVMAPALALIDRPRTIFEAKASELYDGHQVVAKADQLNGAHLIETKTTLSTFDFDKYANSCQWRFMLDIFGAVRCTYHVFCLSEDQAGVIELKSVETFNLFPYAGLRDDCTALVREFAAYVDAKGLRPLLEARQVAAVGAL